MKISSLILAALVLTAPTAVAAQGLGDASKKEQARRKQTQQQGTEAKTYTADDVKGLPPIANEGDAGKPAPSMAAGSAAGSAKAATREDQLRQGDESRWRSRIAGASARLAAARQKHETLASMTLVPGYVYQDERGRTVIGSVEQLQRMTASAKAELDAAQKALDDLLEQARHENVPPGWLR